MAREALYILVRTDIPVADQGVQAGHAVAEWCKRWQHTGPSLPWDNSTLVYLRVPDGSRLLHWVNKLMLRGIDFTMFREPDMENEVTAIACLHTGELFKNMHVWYPV